MLRDRRGRFVKKTGQVPIRVYNRHTKRWGTLVKQSPEHSLTKVHYDGMFFDCWTWTNRLDVLNH